MLAAVGDDMIRGMLATPIERYRILLRLKNPSRFRFFHGNSVRGLLKAAIGRELPATLIPTVCESGNVQFEVGDPYAIGLTLVGPACDLVGTIESGLSRIGTDRQRAALLARRAAAMEAREGRRLASQEHLERPGPLVKFGGNFELERFERLPPLELEVLSTRLESANPIRLRFVSPLQVRLSGAKGSGEEEILDARQFDAEIFLRRLWLRLAEVARECEVPVALLPPSSAGVIASDYSDLLRVEVMDAHKATTSRPSLATEVEEPQGLRIPGVMGEVRLAHVPATWCRVLALGSVIHAGGRTHYGCGRFDFPDHAAPDTDPFRPARSMLDRIASPARLQAAFNHVATHSVAAGVDDISPEDYSEGASTKLEDLAAALGDMRYQPALLRGVVGEKRDGSPRALTIPTVQDRIVQRACMEVMGPAIDSLLEDSSHAYRRGYSRSGAARAIQAAWHDGFRHVLDADIEAFFDSVSWPRLFARVAALFPHEPLLVWIRAWVRTPVEFRGQPLERTQGLPQGAPIAPMLANLFLDVFDEDLLAHGYRLVRYADDFVVLCRSIDDAKAARDLAQQSLERLGLKLNERKTSFTTLDTGLSYLGYLFCRSIVLEESEAQTSSVPLRADPGPAGVSWLAGVDLGAVRALQSQGANPTPAQPQPVPLKQTGTASSGKRTLYITDPLARARVESGALVVAFPERPARKFPLEGIAAVVVVGRSAITTPALLGLARAGAPTFLCGRTGDIRAIMSPHDPDWALWLAQARCAADERACLSVSREIVAAKLHNQATLAVRFRFSQAATLSKELRLLEGRLRAAGTLEEIRGLEGQGAHLWFGAFGRWLPPEWGFNGRKRQPPPDAVNAMLSLGYTMLHTRVASAVVISGLHPRIGLFHKSHGTHQALASDLQEAFRCVVDAQAIASISRRELRPTDFEHDEARGCRFAPEPLKRFIGGLEQRFEREIAPAGERTASLLEHMSQQAVRLARIVRGEPIALKPFRLHA